MMSLMVTDISPILGLNVLEVLEMIAIGTSIALPVAIGISIWVNFKMARRQESRYNDQIEKQAKIDSARLLIELREQMKRDFKGVTDKLYDGKSSECDDVELERYLNHLDMIATYHEDGMLEYKHIKEVLGGLFRRVETDGYMQDFMHEKSEGQKMELYGPLKRLCKTLA